MNKEEIIEKIKIAIDQKEKAIKEQQYEIAAQHRDYERELQEQLIMIEQDEDKIN